MSDLNYLEAYWQERAWLFTLMKDPEGKRFFIERDRSHLLEEYAEQLARMGRFLAFVGDPQAQFKSVHIAGTSGKGSVTVMIASLLQACGLKSADHTSPYLQICNEKLSVNGELITPSQFTSLVRDFRQRYAAWLERGEWLKYGEAWVALTYLWFAQQSLDWGVIETGMGGRFDPTNVLPSSLAVITNIDYDHVQALGGTLEQIAWHKAGIIKEGQRVISAESKPEINAIIAQEAAAKNSEFQLLNYAVNQDGSLDVFGRYQTYTNVNIPQGGIFQKRNAATAITAVDWLAHDFQFEFSPNTIAKALGNLHHAGRFELMQRTPTVILDGAHNPHKMRSLVESVKAVYPQQRVSLLIGFIVGKSAEPMIDALLEIASQFLITPPDVMGKPPQSAESIYQLIRSQNSHIPCTLFPNVFDGLQTWLNSADSADILVITGSIYLIGQARDYWHPTPVLLQKLEENGSI